MSIDNNIVSEVVKKNLCCSCGVCAGLCPTDALSMEIQGNGDLAPCLNAASCAVNCHLCLDICPFAEGVHNPRRMNTEIYSGQPNAKFVEDVGWHTHSIVGFRRDEELRRASASGGLATWCLETLLREGIVTRIAVVRLAKNHDKGFFEFSSASSVDELRQSLGSIYHPVEISDIIKEIASNGQERWAIVGVPCLCAAIRNIGRLRKHIPFMFGLVCGMYQNTFYTEMLLSKSGVDRKHIVGIEYRRKSDGGPPSDFRFRGTENRRHGKEIPYHGLPYYLGRNAFFRLNACNFCMDVFAETADACFMDAWLPDYSSDPRGTSLVVIRNRQIDELLQKESKFGEVWLKEISIEQVIKSQREHVRRKKKLIYVRLKECKKHNKLDNNSAFIEKIDWWLQKRTQIRSKRAWANYGRKYGRFVFWLAMVDIVVIQILLFNFLPRIITLPKGIIRKIAKRIMTAL